MANGGKPGVQHPHGIPRWLKALWDAHPLVVVAIAAVVAVAVSVALIWPITDLIAAHDVGLISGSKRAAALQTAREVVRTQLLTLGAGVFAAGALIFTALNFNLLRRNSKQADQRQRDIYELTEQGQVTDRYTKAIEQLGSKTIDVSIGGVYALERIARDSAKDHPTVMEVLTACIREHSPKQWPKLSKESGAEPSKRTTRPDIQAALTVIGRRDTTHDQQPINLTRANLTRADLAGNLTDADLTRANLTHADLGGATLTQVKRALQGPADGVLFAERVPRVTLDTVKKHVGHVLGKLGAGSHLRQAGSLPGPARCGGDPPARPRSARDTVMRRGYHSGRSVPCRASDQRRAQESRDSSACASAAPRSVSR